MTQSEKGVLKMNIGNRLSSVQKAVIGTLLLGLIVSILLMFNGIQDIIIIILEKVVLGRPLKDPADVYAYKFFRKVAFFGVFSCSLLIALVLYDKQLLSMAKECFLNKMDSFLNKILIKRVCGTTVKEILVRQPFLLIFFLFVLYLIKNTFLAMNVIGFDRLVIVLTFLIHIPVSLFTYRKRDKSITPMLICYLILVLSVLVNAFIFDHSYDGLAYHQVTAIQLNKGWNPFYTYLPGNFLWTNHYPRFTEMLSSIFNNIELGKSYNMIFFIVVFIYALKYTNKFQKRNFMVMAIAIIFTANPVVLAQLFTCLVDGVMGMLVIILIFACMEYEQGQNITDLLIIIAVSVFSINTKFTGFICGFVLMAYIIKQLAMKKYKTMIFLICAGFAILLIGVVFIGYNPYITNIRDFGHPFYPLFGDGAIDIISAQIKEYTFEGFSSMHPIQRFFSLFFLDYSIKNIPFNLVKLISISSHFIYDIRIGGFGVFLAEICILLFLILFFTIKNKNINYYKKLLFPIAIILFISIVMPENWWARYISFFWYLVGFMAMAGDYKSKINKNLFFVCFIIVIINSGSFFILNTFNGIRYTMQFKSILQEIKASPQDTIHIVLYRDAYRRSIVEKFRYYNTHKNIILIKDEDAKIYNGALWYIKGLN
jgi:hypothetical protein